MVSNIQRNASPMDTWLEYEGTKIGYRLFEENGILAWRQGFAPAIAPQVRQDAYSYQHQLPEVDIAVPFEDWGGGAGFTESARKDVYNFAQGLDFSWPGRVYPSPQRQDALENDGTEIAATPVKFWDGSDGFFMIAGAYIYEWDAQNAEWVERDNATGAGDGSAYTDIVEMDGTLYAPRGASADYEYSTDGQTWAAFTDADKNQSFVVVRGYSSGEAVLWGITATGLLRNTTNGVNSGVAWSSDVILGHTSETVMGALEIDNEVYVFKREGIFKYDGTNLTDVWTGGRQMTRSTNGKNPYLWVDGKVYVSYGDRLMQFDPQANDGNGSFDFVWPSPEALGNAELNGTITAVCGDADSLCFFLKNAAGNTYCMKGRPGAFHPIAYLGANDCNAAIIAGAGTVHETNPTLMFGYGTGARFFILPRAGMRPEDDTAYRFDTATGTGYGPWVDVGTKAYPKYLNGGRAVTENATAGMPVGFAYQQDGMTTTTTLLTAVQGGESSVALSSIVQFNRIRYVLTMSTPSAAQAPRLLSLVFNAVPAPPRKRMWTLDLLIGDHMAQRGGGISPTSARSALVHLERALSKRVTLYDRRGRTFTVNVTNVDGIGVLAKSAGDTELMRVTLVEIAETTVTDNILVWDQDFWDSGKVYAA